MITVIGKIDCLRWGGFWLLALYDWYLITFDTWITAFAKFASFGRADFLEFGVDGEFTLQQERIIQYDLSDIRYVFLLKVFRPSKTVCFVSVTVLLGLCSKLDSRPFR